MIDKLVRWYDAVMSRGFDKLRDPLLLILRVMFGWQLFQTGKGKLENIDRFTDFLTHLHIPMPAANAHFVATLECVGGLLLLLGLAARLIAIPLTINFFVAYLTADHEALVGFFKDQEAFTSAAPFLYLLVSLLILAFGPGLFSLDALIRRFFWRRMTA
ncbi:MAG: putative oxidoreductase [Thermoanaerobaculia bacterium]|jgi:putative oxidoreductase|nr:putative oxidoreductase [Thermoanaerobaculia bacterium]